VTPVSSTVDSIEQFVYFVNKANKIAETLVKSGISSDVIHSNKAQSARQLALSRFKEGKSRVLVATDIVSRGIDIDELSHVINYDLPEVPEAYVHRIGRTARAGLSGIALSFCDEPEKKLLKDIEKLIAKDIPVVEEHPYPLVVSEALPVKEVKKISERTGSNRFSGRSNNKRNECRAPKFR
jgi:ATP-dependent RNA helicase RhlE